ncbi:MAG: type II toxin-antitoxin system RelE/ParE family toxin [Arcobacteraceae bacterium]|jgi:plasmid stabilization system protein ParE|nr:type II toxin-antitoxin system RelE/ParE family toxin [Arcobacteraceae bacterium]
MTLRRSELFLKKLTVILVFIAKDSKDNARNFKSSLQHSLNQIENFPYKYRKSIYFDDENIRDFIFKGYCIPYYIDQKNNEIVLLSILKWNLF